LNKQSYYSNGKLLITGEYLVMNGAYALAVPTLLGQGMSVERNTGMNEYQDDGKLVWESYYNADCWFKANFLLTGMDIVSSTEPERAIYLQKILREAGKLNPEILSGVQSLKIQSSLGFNTEWGLGSSSSLINNIASCFKVDPYQLFFNTQNGSAYDIACAGASGPVFYRLEDGQANVEKAVFNPAFKKNIAFIYSGQKQDSRQSLSNFLARQGSYEFEKGIISEISRELAAASHIQEFSELLDEHEKIMSKVIGMPKVKDDRFSDFPGSIKSLGAWGGDFILAAAEIDFVEIKSYFSTKGLDIVFSFDELVLIPKA